MARAARLGSTCSPETLDSSGETFGSGQQVVFQFRQPLGFSYFHADAVLGLCETSSFTVQQKLSKTKAKKNPRRP